MSPFISGHASIVGSAHVANGVDNQDALSMRLASGGSVVVAVVCDGAGSALKAGQGSRFFADELAESFASIDSAAVTRGDPEELRRDLMHRIEEVRARFESSVGPDLRDYHCTMTACVASRTSAVLLQIGDSVSLITRVRRAPTAEPSGSVVEFDDTRIIAPEKGEYANETYFITQPDWQSHLQIETFPQKWGLIALMSDGTAALVLEGRAIKSKFLTVLAGWILDTPQEASDILRGALADDRAAQQVSDDRTLVIIMQPDSIESQPITAQQAAPNILTPDNLTGTGVNIQSRTPPVAQPITSRAPRNATSPDRSDRPRTRKPHWTDAVGIVAVLIAVGGTWFAFSPGQRSTHPTASIAASSVNPTPGPQPTSTVASSVSSAKNIQPASIAASSTSSVPHIPADIASNIPAPPIAPDQPPPPSNEATTTVAASSVERPTPLRKDMAGRRYGATECAHFDQCDQLKLKISEEIKKKGKDEEWAALGVLVCHHWDKGAQPTSKFEFSDMTCKPTHMWCGLQIVSGACAVSELAPSRLQKKTHKQ